MSKYSEKKARRVSESAAAAAIEAAVRAPSATVPALPKRADYANVSAEADRAALWLREAAERLGSASRSLLAVEERCGRMQLNEARSLRISAHAVSRKAGALAVRAEVLAAYGKEAAHA